MSNIKNFPGTSSPVLSFGPDKRYGPTLYKIVKLRNNVPPTSVCQLTSQGKAQGTCWVTVQPFEPLPLGQDGPGLMALPVRCWPVGSSRRASPRPGPPPPVRRSGTGCPGRCAPSA